jgi:hypothetical protein
VVEQEPVAMAWHWQDTRGGDHRLDPDALPGRVD